MKFGSLFSGIGGIDLGLERAGMECIWQVEFDPYCQRVLEKHWPEVTRYGDIKNVDWRQVERPDLICGGFPCQPVSLAGKGLAEEDERWLWPEFARCLRELRPRLVLLENVPGLLARGRGFGGVLGGLASLGYDAEWERIPAASVGAPHLRWRVFVVAYRNSGRFEVKRISEHEELKSSSGHQLNGCGSRGWRDGETYPDSEVVSLGSGLYESESGSERGRRSRDEDSERREVFEGWRVPDLIEHWHVEPDVGRVANGVPSRVDRLRCLGNAVVPQVAEWVGRRIFEWV